ARRSRSSSCSRSWRLPLRCGRRISQPSRPPRRYDAGMPFAELDRGALARALAPLAERSDDIVDAFLERLEIVELPRTGDPPGGRLGRGEGLAVRLCREGRTWLASRDRLDGTSFADALRQVARVHPRAAPPAVALGVPPVRALPTTEEMDAFPRLVDRAL